MTVVVPTFRRPRLLKRALKSIRLQSYSALRVVVYDNASGDETAAVVRQFSTGDPRFHYHAHAANLGSAANFRYGMEHVDTEFFSFLSDDDLLLPRFCELAVAALDQHPDALFAVTRVVHVSQGRTFAREAALKPGLHHPPEGLLAMLRQNQPTWTGVLFRREVLTKVGTLDDRTVIDLDFELRAAAHNSFVVVPEDGALFNADEHFAKCLDWSEAWDRTTSKLAADPALPAEVRQFAVTSMRERLRTMVLQTGIVAARMGRTADARLAAKLLSEQFDDHRGGRMVSALAFFSPFAPHLARPARWLRTGVRATLVNQRSSPSETLREELEQMAPELVAGLVRDPS